MERHVHQFDNKQLEVTWDNLKSNFNELSKIAFNEMAKPNFCGQDYGELDKLQFFKNFIEMS